MKSSGLKIRYPQGCEGSTPFSGTDSRWFLFFRKSPRRSHFHGYLNRFNMTPLLSLRQKTRSYAPPTCAPCCLNHCPAWASHFVSANKRGGTIREGLHRIAAWLGDSVFLRSQGDGRASVESRVLDQRRFLASRSASGSLGKSSQAMPRPSSR